MTRARERFDDMGSDEAGTAGNEDAHGPEIIHVSGRAARDAPMISSIRKIYYPGRIPPCGRVLIDLIS